jgi:integrase
LRSARAISVVPLRQLFSIVRPLYAAWTHAALHALLGEAVEEGIITANPAARRGRTRTLNLSPSQGEREEQLKAFDRHQLSSLLDAIRVLSPRHYPMFLTMARTGIRLGEAFGLQWQDVDLKGREIRVARGTSAGRVETPKSGKARSVDVSLALRDVLERHDAASKAAFLKDGRERPADSWVFPSLEGTPLDRANVEKAFKRALKHAGLPLHFTPHCLRHTYASLLLQDGVSPAYVQEQLGHSSIKLTVDTYGRWLRKKAPGAVDRLDDAPAGESGSRVVAGGPRPPRQSLQVVGGVGGPRGARTRDLLIANQALSQLS